MTKEKNCARMLAALFKITPKWKLKRPSNGEWINDDAFIQWNILHKKEQNTDTRSSSMDEFHRHYAVGKPVTKQRMLYDSICYDVLYQAKVIRGDTNQNKDVGQRLGRGMRNFSGAMKCSAF